MAPLEYPDVTTYWAFPPVCFVRPDFLSPKMAAQKSSAVEDCAAERVTANDFASV